MDSKAIPFMVLPSEPTPIDALDEAQRARIEPFMTEWKRVSEVAAKEGRPVLSDEVETLRTITEKFGEGTAEREAVEFMFAFPIAGATARSYMAKFPLKPQGT